MNLANRSLATAVLVEGYVKGVKLLTTSKRRHWARTRDKAATIRYLDPSATAATTISKRDQVRKKVPNQFIKVAQMKSGHMRLRQNESSNSRATNEEHEGR
ncbi:hypothetical protein TNCV_3057671 [Trichonephila clavipes]|nr:hypothetical protein TNCV_3057671 [Trichonephila clavipes]